MMQRKEMKVGSLLDADWQLRWTFTRTKRLTSSSLGRWIETMHANRDEYACHEYRQDVAKKGPFKAHSHGCICIHGCCNVYYHIVLNITLKAVNVFVHAMNNQFI